MQLTFNVTGLKDHYQVSSKSVALDPKEKKLFRWQIAKNFIHSNLPIHACLLVKNNLGILIAGASGSGKSTLSQFFLKLGYISQANDFVCIWIENKTLYGGALDLIHLNSKRIPVKIDHCYFLDPADSRDVFKYTMLEAKQFYATIMKPWKSQTSNQFSSSKVFKHLLQKHIGYGNRSTINRWEKLVSQTLTPLNFHRVGIIGLGVIGQDIANLIVNIPNLKQLNLYSPNKHNVHSLTLDLLSAGGAKVVSSSSLKNCISSSDILIFSFRSHEKVVSTELQERYARVHAHAKIIWQITRELRKLNYPGVILVVSNPVDLLSLFTYHFSNINSQGNYDWLGLFSNQVYGVGLGLDYARLQVISHKKLELTGEHSELQWLAEADKSWLRADTTDKPILTKLKKYSSSIRQWAERTRFGPSHEVFNIVKTFISGSKAVLRLSTASSQHGYWGQPIELDVSRLVPASIFNLDKALTSHVRSIEKTQHQFLAKLTHELSHH